MGLHRCSKVLIAASGCGSCHFRVLCFFVSEESLGNLKRFLHLARGDVSLIDDNMVFAIRLNFIVAASRLNLTFGEQFNSKRQQSIKFGSLEDCQSELGR